jgi:hypothetical protein
MLQIVYTSAANQEFSSAELERLLAGARRRNRTAFSCKRSKARRAP